MRGTPGTDVERLDHRGRLVSTATERRPVAGGDVRLSIDPRLQATAEQLLASACRARAGDSEPAAAGGAVVVMDVASGELLAAASAPALHRSCSPPAMPRRWAGCWPRRTIRWSIGCPKWPFRPARCSRP